MAQHNRQCLLSLITAWWRVTLPRGHNGFFFLFPLSQLRVEAPAHQVCHLWPVLWAFLKQFFGRRIFLPPTEFFRHLKKQSNRSKNGFSWPPLEHRLARVYQPVS